MFEFLRVSAMWLNIVICLAGIVVAYFWVTDWLIGKLWRGAKWHLLIIDYALNHKKYKKWKSEQRINLIIS